MKIKTFFGWVGIVLVAVALLGMQLDGRAASSLVNPNGYTTAGFSGAGTAQGATNSFFVASAYVNGNSPYYNPPLTPVVRFADVSSDLTSSKVQFYALTNRATVFYTNNTTVVTVDTTNQFVAADVLLGYHPATDQYERLTLVSIAGATNSAKASSYLYTLTLAWAPIVQFTTNDLIWRAKAWGSLTVGNTNNFSLGGAHAGFQYVGQPGLPLLMEVNGTSTATINCVSGDYR